MPFPTLLLVLAAFTDVRVVDQTYQIPPNNWRYVDAADWRAAAVDWRDSPVTVHAAFAVEAGPTVRVLMLEREHLDELRQGAAPAPVATTPFGRGGMLTARTGSPADSVLVIENRGSPETAIVHLRVTLDSWNAAVVSPERKLWVIGLSFAFFFATITYSAAKLRRAFGRPFGPTA